MFKVILLLLVIFMFVVTYSIIDFTKIVSMDSINFIYFCNLIILMYLYIEIRFGLTKIYKTITPFFLYSIFFWWLSFYLLFLFSSYRVSSIIYEISILSFTSILFFYEILSILFPSFKEFQFKNKLLSAKEDYNIRYNYYDLFWKVCLFFSFTFTTLFFIKAGNIPMLADNPEIARVNAMKGSGTIQRFSYLTLHFGIISYIIITFIQNKPIKKTFLLLIIFLVFYNMLTGPRSYALWGLVFIYITYQILKYKKMKIIHGLFFLSIIMLIVAIVGGIRYSGLDNTNIDDTLIRFINRLYMNPVNADRIVNFFQNPIETNSFIIELSVLLPGYQPDLGTYLKDLMGIQFDGGGITVPLPAEGYMNYGYVGVVIYSFIYAVILKLFEIYIHTTRPTILSIMLMIIIPIQFMGMITMGISGIIVKTTIPVIVVFMTMKLITKILNRSLR